MLSVEILRGRVVTPGAVLEDGVVEIDGDRLVAVRPAATDDPPTEADQWLLPGLVDLHNHGGGGASFTVPDPEQVAVAAAHHLARGTTTLLGSAVTDSPERMLAVTATLADAVDTGALAGIHLEGPFLAESCKGAQDARYLRGPDPGLTAELIAAGRGQVKVMTLAAELPGADAVADLLLAEGVVVALGHTAADATTARRFLGSRARLVTHLFNGMPPMHHRSPGPALAALAAAGTGAAWVELVADGVHLADETIRAALSIAGPRSVFVTDAMAAAGMPDGDYVLGPQRVTVAEGVARLTEGGAIAGGTSSLLDQVRRHATGGLDPVTLAHAAATSPAAVVGLGDVGALAPGLRADVVIADADLAPVRVMRAGVWVEESGHVGGEDQRPVRPAGRR